MLIVVNLDEEVVYFMDSLKRRLVMGEWSTIVDKWLVDQSSKILYIINCVFYFIFHILLMGCCGFSYIIVLIL